MARLTTLVRGGAGLHQRAVEPAPRVLALQGRADVAVVLQVVADDQRGAMLAAAAAADPLAGAEGLDRHAVAEHDRVVAPHRPPPDRRRENRGQPPVVEQFGLDVFQVGAGLVLGVGDDPDVRFPALPRRRGAGRQSVPMVDLAPPRGPSTLSFVPRAVRAASSCSASQRCMFEGGRRKWSGRYFRPQASRSSPPLAAAGHAAGPRPCCAGQVVAPHRPDRSRDVSSRHRPVGPAMRHYGGSSAAPPASAFDAQSSRATASMLLENVACDSVLGHLLDDDRRRTASAAAPICSTVITSGPRRAYFSGKPRSSAQAAARQYCSFFAALRMFFDQADFGVALGLRASLLGELRIALGRALDRRDARSRRTRRPRAGCTPR